jgi:DAK2 domain fusion protein YloV
MLQELDAAAVRRWADGTAELLAAHRTEIDRINVYPVPDADTGTNLLATMRAAVHELGGAAPTGPLAALARGALLGARGNSGLVLCQLLRGLAEACPDGGPLTASRLVDGLRRGAGLARLAFVEPASGTVLSVLAAAADAADTARATGTGQLAAVTEAVLPAAAAALADTPRQLPVLAAAGVVDAGGLGIQLVLEALAAVVEGREPATAPLDHGAAPATVARSAAALTVSRPPGDAGEHEYEVMYLLDGCAPRRLARLRAELAGLGDSVAVVGDGTVWNVHVHCTDVGAAVEAGVRAGRPHRITVIRFADQVAAGRAASPTGLTRARAVVAVAAGEGLSELLRGEGATVVPLGAEAGDGLLAAIAGTRAAHVVVLPNSASAIAAADAAAEHSRAAGQEVVVLRTTSPVQAIAALAVHDPARRAADDVVAMAEAAAATRCGELSIAGEEALTWAGRCRPGDVLGLVDGEVVLIGDDVVAAGCALVRRMLAAGGELVTALIGAHAPGELATVLAGELRREHPEVELAVHHVGQQPGPLLVGVE